MKLGILGTGHVATTLASAWSKTHEITLGSRTPGSKRLDYPVLPLADTVRAADIVVNATLGSLLADLGWSDDDIVDLGGLDTARGPEHHIVLFAKLAGLLRTEAFKIRVVR